MNPWPNDPESLLRSLRRHYRQLQTLFVAALGAVLILSVGINIFIFQQMRVARAQAASSRAVVQAIASQYQTKEPAMRQFVNALQSFALEHPDFQPVLQRYRVTLPQFFTRPTLIVSNQIPSMTR